ncbi:ester cyclase [Tautonia plasticadhaerens]|uniref:SnoaL-like polyketide cyclase n=1 Tax=Tautonia plasticadhaerens TaxID=2527974 RepID=A0A518GYW8_9BACT|nr:ester cyclase [Tautonia plasticadhaerens]QDV33757.1 SnoaL-like polyketide cyclase [Tautonia plasticadhaerens]
MSSANKAVVTRLIEARNANDTEAFVSLFVPDMQDHMRGAFVGVSRAFPDVHITLDELIAEGDKVVARWTFNGTHLGNFQDIPATGKSVIWTGIDIYTVRDGRITSHERKSDMLGLMQQLGVAPSE